MIFWLFALCLVLLAVIFTTVVISVEKIQADPNWQPPLTLREWWELFR